MQSEVEGVDNENVGFYGRCMLHAAHPSCELDSDPINVETDSTGEKELTCGRTEVFSFLFFFLFFFFLSLFTISVISFGVLKTQNLRFL